MNSLRGGMQVHAVPEEERARDQSGRQLPWGYAYADSSLNRKQVTEKGPFGRATNRRSMSRKAATPVRKEDAAKGENMKIIDDIFGKFKQDQEEKHPAGERKAVTAQSVVVHSRSTADVGLAALATASSVPKAQTFNEPTEVIIYGFGSEYQYAAIEFYETISSGRIYEDYDRYPPNPRYNTFASTTRASIPRTLSQDAIRKINAYSGGEHWIKVTFDSPQAAELACHYSPHIIHGYSVHAQPYRGQGPSADVALTAGTKSHAGTLRQRRPDQGGLRDYSSLPSRIHSAPILTQTPGKPQSTLSLDSISPDSSETTTATASSATATAVDPSSASITHHTDASPATSSPQKPLKIATAKRAVLLPASSALLPVPPWTQRTFGSVPIIGSFVGGPVGGAKGNPSGSFIGTVVPRKEDGTFDWEKASWWWRICWIVDSRLPTDLCGFKGDE